MGEGKCSPGPWKAIENSWQYTTIYDAHDREICRLDLERFEDLNEETQDKYESIQRADAAAIVRACDHDAALRRAKAEGMREAAIRAREFSRPYSMEWWCSERLEDNDAYCQKCWTTLQADYATLRGLAQALPYVKGVLGVRVAEVELGDMWAITVDGYFDGNSALFETEIEANAYMALLNYRASLPAQPAQGGA